MELDNNILLEVKNLKTQFKTENGTVTAVDDISFTIKKGETIGIVGESGSGKSVTSLSIMKLLPESFSEIVNGEIWFNSPKEGPIDLVQRSNKEMRRIRGKEISMIFQEPMTSLNPVYKCGDQLVEAILLHSKFNKKIAKEMVIELFDVVQLPDPKRVFGSYPHEISGGQKQRVMIAMAMVCNPSLLIADEPTTALDVTVQKNILDLMRSLRDDIETSIIFITHDFGVVADIADRVIVMYKGKIVEQGTTWDIFSNPQHPYTKGLLSCRPSLEMNLKKLPTISDFMYVNYDNETVRIDDFNLKEGGFLMETEDLERAAKQKEAMYSGEACYKVENLKVHFDTEKNFLGKVTKIVKAVDNISFEVYKGETLGLVGESGCGKTTLGRALLGLIPATGGKVITDGVDLLKLSHSQWRTRRKDLQIIFQDPYSSLNPRKSIGNSIIEPMKVHNIFKTDSECKQKAFELLEKVGLNRDQYNRFPHEFSGGQRQRVCIARALAVNPSFIICDESVSALDVSVQAQVLNLLNDLKEEFQFTYIFVSHDLSVVKFMSDRILVMNKGKIEELDFAENIYQNPKSEYTKKLIISIPQGRLEDVRKSMKSREKKTLINA